MTLSFAISSWSGWTNSGVAADSVSADILRNASIVKENHISVSQSPDVSVIPPLLRRRLNAMGRACVGEMLRHLGEGDSPAIVYCSRHGDIERTLDVLREQANGGPLSPINFSLAVHNAITGVISIHQQISANISSIAAGDEALVPVLLEAAGLLSDTCPAILCVFCDVTLPEIYRDPQQQAPAPYAACLRITRDQGLAVSLQLEADAVIDADDLARTEPLAFVGFLSSAREAFLTRHNSGYWTVRKLGHPTDLA